jgi:HD superfamily phosphodiesterase
LDGSSDRWRHVEAAADRASEISAVLPSWSDRTLLVDASLLHDIGHAPAAYGTGLHQLDGARYLRGLGAEPRLCSLVAHHSFARIEARARGLETQLLEEFPPEESDVADALTYIDMTTGPDGRRVEVLERLAEIERRYSPGHLVSRSIRDATPQILAAVARIEAKLAAQPK